MPIISFSEKNYLKKHPDVAAHSYYKDHAYEHYTKHGQYEGRHPNPAYIRWPEFNAKNYVLGHQDVFENWDGTAWDHYDQWGYDEGRNPNPKPPDDNVILEVAGASMMSLCRLSSGSILGGTYSEGSPIPAIYQDGIKKLSVDCGESIFSMRQQGNTLFFSTENDGGCYRVDLTAWNPTRIKTLLGGVFGGAFDVRIIDGKVFYIGGRQIYVVGIGVVLDFSDDFYIKSIYKLGDTYYAPGWRRSRNGTGHWYSKDLKSWHWRDGPKNHRWIRGETSPDGTRAILVGMLDYSGMQYHDNTACLFMHDANGIRPHVGFNGYKYTSCAKWGDNGTILAGATRGWRSQEQGCQLIKVTHTTQMLGYYREAELREIEIGEDNYYVATRTDKVGGRIIRVKKN